MAAWRVNTVTVTTASVNTDMVRTARDTRAAKDIETCIKISYQMKLELNCFYSCFHKMCSILFIRTKLDHVKNIIS